MKKGFTLIELLGIILLLGLLATIIVPQIQKTIKNNKENLYAVQEKKIIESAKNWGAANLDSLPEMGFVNIKLSELKKYGINIGLSNPKTGKILSNETYVKITRIDNNYKYDVYAYDIPDTLSVDRFTSNDLSFINEIAIGSTFVDPGVSVVDSGGNIISSYSTQIILNGKEVSNIETDNSNIYNIVYTALDGDTVLKAVRVITIQ